MLHGRVALGAAGDELIHAIHASAIAQKLRAGPFGRGAAGNAHSADPPIDLQRLDEQRLQALDLDGRPPSPARVGEKLAALLLRARDPATERRLRRLAATR